MHRFVSRIVLSLATILLLVVPALAQTGDWAAVEGIATGTSIFVKTSQGKKLKGTLESVDSSRLILWSSERHFPGRAIIQREILRTDVKEVRLSHPYASAAVGAAIGAGIGIGIGTAIDAQYPNHEDRGVVQIVFGLLGAGVGSAVGRTTSFIKGHPVYLAP